MPICDAIKKYGEASFCWSVLTICQNQKDLNTAEKYWVEFLDTLAPNGYNLKEGGGATGKYSVQARENISRSLIGNKNRSGKTFSVESRKKISDTLKSKGIKPPSRKGSVPWNKK